MSSEQTFSTSDLRSTAQDYKRDAARKHKWAYGATEAVSGRAEASQRPYRASEFNLDHRMRTYKHENPVLARSVKMHRKFDLLEGVASASDDSSATNSDEYDDSTIPATEGIMFSFDADRSPSQGSQILNVALAQAVERFEERETVKLIKDEYDVLDTTGEVVPQVSSQKKARKGKTKAKAVSASSADVDEDYEFV